MFRIIFFNLLLVYTLVSPLRGWSQEPLPQKASIKSFQEIYSKFNRKRPSYQSLAFEKSRSGNAYDFIALRGVIGALNSIIGYSKGNSFYIDQQKQIIDNMINSARFSYEISDDKSPFHDHYKGWISLTPKRSFHREVVLYEGYAFFYVAQFLYYLKNSRWIDISLENKEWWGDALHFLETNIWEKWVTRCQEYQGNKYWYFLRGRIHMGSHWAGIAMYLKDMTSDSVIKDECEKLQQEYDLLLKRNLKPNPDYPDAYVWNSTYDNVEGTDATKVVPSIVQDVSHGNHVVTYIIAAYGMGDKNWTLDDIDKLCNTLKKIIYKKDTRAFSDKVDGSGDVSRPGWGNFEADGWVKLSKFDSEVYNIFSRFAGNTDILKKYHQELQFKANFLHFGKYHNHRDSSSFIK